MRRAVCFAWMVCAAAVIVLVATVGSSRADSATRGSFAQASDAKDGKRATVKGRVTRDGRPAEEIFVRLLIEQTAGGPAKRPDTEPGKLSADLDTDGQHIDLQKSGRGRVVATARTDASGNFSLEAPAGSYKLVAGNRSVGQAEMDVELREGESLTKNLELKR